MQVLAVDAGRIAVRTKTGVKLLAASGSVLRDVAVVGRVAALSGRRLAVRTSDAVEIYDTDLGSSPFGFPCNRASGSKTSGAASSSPPPAGP